MKFQSVKQMQEIIDKQVEEDDKFEQSLMEKYPSLFHEVNGTLTPATCGIYCPPGWRDIIDNLCGAIVDRTENVFTMRIKPGKIFALKSKTIDFIRSIKSIIYKFFNPYKGLRAFMRYNSPGEKEWDIVKKKLSYKICHWLELATLTIGKDLYEKAPASPPVKIAQVKEKFGTLRFYYDGGDDTIRGMVEFAEYLSSKTCQETGKRGSLCVKGKGYAWYATLSPKKAKELGYKKVNE